MNDEKEVEKIKKECGWDLVPEPPIGDPKNKDFFEADAHKVLDYCKSCYERGRMSAYKSERYSDPDMEEITRLKERVAELERTRT